jgi:antitoxin ParD1/3/4
LTTYIENYSIFGNRKGNRQSDIHLNRVRYTQVVRHYGATENRKIIENLLQNTINWYICKKYKIMARNTSILIGEYYESFINRQIATGKYNSVSEVVRTALRHFEQEEIQTKSLIAELELGEKSVKIRNFNRTENLKRLNDNFQK